MQKVQLAPLWSVVAGAAGLALISLIDVLSGFGWGIGLLYLVVSSTLLARGLRWRRTTLFGPANTVTLVRSTLVGLVAAVVATSFTEAISLPLLIALTVPALALDAVDGFVARRTHTISELGARFDMEVDAFLILVLGAYVAQDLGWWVLTLGLLRYAYVVAGWAMPWLRRPVPPRYWAKVVAAFAGIALALAASGLVDRWLEIVVTLIALGLLLESFGRDVVWQFIHRGDPAEPAIAASEAAVR